MRVFVDARFQLVSADADVDVIELGGAGIGVKGDVAIRRGSWSVSGVGVSTLVFAIDLNVDEVVVGQNGKSITYEVAGKLWATEKEFRFSVGSFAVERKGLRTIGLALQVDKKRRVLAALPIGVDAKDGTVAADGRVFAADVDDRCGREIR